MASGVSLTYVVAGLLIPFSVILMLARPHWAAMGYAVLVYTDLLSILVKYHDMPSLARFVGWALFGAVLAYRLIAHKEGLVGDRVTLWLALYGGVVALGLVYARSPSLVMTNVIEFTRIFLAYLIIVNCITTTGRLRITLWLLLGAGVFLASLTIFQSITGNYDNDFGGLAQFRVSEITGTSDAPRPGGTLGDANYYGQSLLILLPISLYLLAEGRRWLARVAGGLATLCLVLAIIFTYSRGDAVALGTVLVAGVLYKRPNPLYLLGGIVATLIVVPFLPSNYVSRLTTIVDVASSNRQAILSEDSVRGRAGASQAAVEMFLDHPLLGVGRENYPLYELEYLAGSSLAKSAKGIPPHNLYLEVAAENGILGIIVVGGLLFMTFRALFEARKRFRAAGDHTHAELAAWLAIGLLGYLVSSLFLHGAFIWMLGLQIALIVALRQISRSASPDFVSLQLPALTPAVATPLQVDSEIQTSPQPLTPRPERIQGVRSVLASGARAVQSVLPARRPAPQPEARPLGDDDRRNLWLAAAEVARSQGDLMTARALVDAVLVRDPQNEAAWQMDLRLWLSSNPSKPSIPATSTVAPGSHSGTVSSRWQGQASHRIAEPFRDYWRRHGAAGVLGMAISPPFFEPTSDGRAVLVQYFERARMEHYAEPGGATAEVSLGDLGLEVPTGGEVASPLPSGLGGRQVSLAEGSIETPWKFSIFWHLNGGEVVLGLPITPVLLEKAHNGDQMVVQYFERARLEYHADLAGTVDEVSLGNLGVEVFQRRYGERQ